MTQTISRTWKTVYLDPTDCCVCGVVWGMPNDLNATRISDGKSFYCPNGHSQHYSENDATRLKREKARSRHLEDQLQASKDEAEQTRRTLVRERSRFANGVCPCCNRSFQDVLWHMRSQHPKYDPSHLLPSGSLFACTCSKTFDSYHALRSHQGHMSWGRHETKV